MMMENWSILLISILATLSFMGGAAGLIYLGYWMGRNSADRPVRSDNNPKLLDQGSKEDPGGDPYEEALLPLEDEESRIDTIR